MVGDDAVKLVFQLRCSPFKYAICMDRRLRHRVAFSFIYFKKKKKGKSTEVIHSYCDFSAKCFDTCGYEHLQFVIMLRLKNEREIDTLITRWMKIFLFFVCERPLGVHRVHTLKQCKQAFQYLCLANETSYIYSFFYGISHFNFFSHHSTLASFS